MVAERTMILRWSGNTAARQPGLDHGQVTHWPWARQSLYLCLLTSKTEIETHLSHGNKWVNVWGDTAVSHMAMLRSLVPFMRLPTSSLNPLTSKGLELCSSPGPILFTGLSWTPPTIQLFGFILTGPCVSQDGLRLQILSTTQLPG